MELAPARWVAPRALAVPAWDAVLAGVMAALVLGDVVFGPDWRGPTAVNAVVVPSAALALAWRRRAPLTVLVVAMGAQAGLALSFGASQTWSSLFITVVAVYSAAAHGSSTPVTVLATGAGVAIHDLNDPAIVTFGDWLWSSTLAGLTILVGLSGRALRHREDAVQGRADALELEEQERAAAVAAEERRRIARELHDIVAHSLGLVVLQAGAAEQVLDRDPQRARDALASIRATGQQAIGEMGTLLGLLRGDAAAPRQPQPSLADLDSLVATMRTAGLRTDVEIQGPQRALPAALELSAFRILQEGLTNALKHAGPARVQVVVRFGERELEVEVVDDGSGAGGGRGCSRGLAGIAERVAVFGGQFEAGPRREGGWGLRAVLPAPR